MIVARFHLVRSFGPLRLIAVMTGLALLVAVVAACGRNDRDADRAGGSSTTSTSASSTTATPSSTTTAPAGGTTTVAGGCGGTGLTAHRGIAYGTDSPLQALDVYQPTRPAGCGPAPIVVWVHGGAFRIGSRNNQVADKARLFTDEGWVFVAVDYRLSPNPPSKDPQRIRYPAHEQDVAAALAWVDAHAGEYGGDPQQILLMGHSSGAFLVTLISTDPTFVTQAGLDPRQIRCTVSLDTEYDIIRQVSAGRFFDTMYRNAFGDDPETWAEGSPSHHVASAGSIPPFLLFTRGTRTRIAGTRSFAAQLTKAGVPNQVIEANPLSHGDVNAAVGKAGDTVVTPPVLAFYRSCVAGTVADPR